MLTNESKQCYQQILADCDYTLFRHPQRTMAERLQALVPLAEQFEQPDCYGQGKLINEFEQQVAELLGQPAALFLPSGTMAQPMALRIWADKKSCHNVAFHPTSHLQLHEQMGYQHLHGLQAKLAGQPEQVVRMADLVTIDEPLAALLLELPMREIGGQLPQWDELLEQRQWATENNIALHLDGARLWSCTSYYNKTLAQIGGLFDSVYVSFYKDLDGIAGAVLAGSEEFIAQARIWTRRYGGNLITLFPDILAAKQGLQTNLPLMAEFVAKAGKVAGYFAEHDVFRLIPEQPPCNLFHIQIEQPAESLMAKVQTWSKQHHIGLLPLPRSGDDQYCRFEITINSNALALDDNKWRQAIDSLAVAIAL